MVNTTKVSQVGHGLRPVSAFGFFSVRIEQGEHEQTEETFEQIVGDLRCDQRSGKRSQHHRHQDRHGAGPIAHIAAGEAVGSGDVLNENGDPVGSVGHRSRHAGKRQQRHGQHRAASSHRIDNTGEETADKQNNHIDQRHRFDVSACVPTSEDPRIHARAESTVVRDREPMLARPRWFRRCQRLSWRINMRRGIASLLMGLSLVLGSAGWAGLTLSSTVLDETASHRLATQALNHPSVREALITRVAESMAKIVPDDEPMSRQDLADAARSALQDPRALEVLTNAVAEDHRRGLADLEPEPFFAHIDSNEAARLALLDQNPALTGRILVNPLVRIVLPTSGLNWLSGLKHLVDRFAVLAIAGALVGFAATFVVARNATAAMRRAAFWVLGAAAFWVAVAVLYTVVGRAVTPSSYTVLLSAGDSFFAAMRPPTVLMAVFGTGMLATSIVVPALDRRRGARLVARAQRTARATSTVGRAALRSYGNQPQPDGSSTAIRRVSPDWLEGRGYTDDARVAPFLKPPSELIGIGGSRTDDSSS